MRPVTKGTPTTFVPNYRFYTLPSLNAPPLQHFNANSAISIAFNDDTVTPHDMTVAEMQEAILNWDHNGVDPFAPGVSNGEKNAAVRSLKKRLEKLYRLANPHLSEQLGDYCSYCEIYMPGHEIDVEHSLPKGPYPRRTVLWANFLQGCGRCNSAKGQKPSRANAIVWSGGAPTEAQIMAAALGHYFWPDRAADSFRRLSYQLCDVGGYAAIPMGPATNRRNALASFRGYQVRADVQLAAGAARTLNHRVEVTVRASAIPAGLAPATAAQVANTGLGVPASARAGYRTRTWFRVTAQMKIIFSAIYNNDNQVLKRRLFRLGWRSFMQAAQSFGHYSTIVTVLQQYPYPAYMAGGGAYLTLADRFVHDSDPANAGPDAVYAGTNTLQVP